MKKILGGFLLLLIISTNASCIFGKSSIVAMSYRNDNVYLSNKQTFKVGSLSSNWKKKRIPVHAIAFHNKDIGATIATDAFCGPSYEDLPLTMLTSHMLAGVTDYKIVKSYEFMLNGRGALRTIAEGNIDGVPLSFDVVVLKKNKCMFDFMCITPSGTHNLVANDFENFYTGFRYNLNEKQKP